MRYFLIILLLCPVSAFAEEYHFASIENLVEQEIGRIVLPRIYQKLGINITITPLPANRAQTEARKGIKDGEIMRIWSYGGENPTTIRVPTPYYYLETMCFIRKDSGISIRTIDDLRPLKIAKIRGVKHTNNITTGMPHVFDMDNRIAMMKVLENGRVDVAITNTIDGLQIIQKGKFSNVINSGKPLAVLKLYHYIHESHKDLVPKIDEVIIKMKENGELETLINEAEKEVLVH